MSSLQQQLVGLLGNDPVEGGKILAQLKQDRPPFPDVFNGALAVEDPVFHGIERMASLSATYGREAGDFLVARIETESWHVKQLAADCFKYFSYALANPVANALMNIVKRGQDIDAERLAIEALGQMGADGWARDIVEAVLGPDEPLITPSSYTVEKLSFYAAQALARMVAREATENKVSSDLWWLNKFLERVPKKGEPGKLLPTNSVETGIERGLAEITSIAVTPLAQEWLYGRWSFTQRLAATAIGRLRLDRTARMLVNRSTDNSVEVSVRRECLSALMDFGTPAGMAALRPELEFYQEEDELKDSTLSAYSALFICEPKVPVNEELVQAIVACGGEAKAQLVYGLGVLQQRLDLIEEELNAQDAFFRATAALALARSHGAKAAPRLRGLLRDAATVIERLFILTALVHAGEPRGREALAEGLAALQPPDRSVFLFRHHWKREMLAALHGADSEPSPEARAWAGVMREDLDRCMEEMRVIVGISVSQGGPTQVHVAVETPKHERAAGGGPGQASQPAPGSQSAGQRPTKVFVSYSHEDAGSNWFKEVKTALDPLARDGMLDLWNDTRIDPGADWKAAVKAALDNCDIALLLVTDSFIASRFIATDELPQLLEAAETRGLKILWLPASASLYKRTKIEKYQALIDPKRPLDTFDKPKRKAKLVEIAEKILHAAQK